MIAIFFLMGTSTKSGKPWAFIRINGFWEQRRIPRPKCGGP